MTHAARGAIFETWVVGEMLKNCYNRGLEPDIYLWRASAGREVDLLIDQGATQTPIETQSGQTIASDFFKDLDFRRSLAGQPDGPAGVVYGGDASFRRRRVSVIAWSDWT